MRHIFSILLLLRVAVTLIRYFELPCGQKVTWQECCTAGVRR